LPAIPPAHSTLRSGGALAAWLTCVATDEEYGEPDSAPRIGERTTALGLADLVLASAADPADEKTP
jgi:hypothetical protein